MSSKRAVKLIIILASVLVIGLGVLFLLSLQRQDPKGVQDTPRNPFPFGNISPRDPTDSDPSVPPIVPVEVAPDPIESEEQIRSRFYQLTSAPVAGYQPVIENNTQALYYMRSSTGNVHRIELDGTSIREELITDTLIPFIGYATFSSSGDKLRAARFDENLQEIITYAGDFSVDQALTLTDVEKLQVDSGEAVPGEESLIEDANPSVSPITETADGCIQFDQDLILGSSGDAVVALQQFLNSVDVSTEIDGQFGSATASRVGVYQILNELPVSQELDIQTRTFINARCPLASDIESESTSTTGIQAIGIPVSAPAILPVDDDQVQSQDLRGAFLTQRIIDQDFAPNGDQVISIIETEQGSAIQLEQADGSVDETLARLPLSELWIDWNTQDSAHITTKASAYSEGFSWSIDPSSGIIERLFGNIIALTTKPDPVGDWTLLGTLNQDGSPSLQLYDHNENQFRLTNLRTLPEKCGWSDDGGVIYCGVPQSIVQAIYPDEWYQGFLQFADTLWQIDPITQNSRALETPEMDLDMIEMQVSPDGSWIYFVDQTTGFLWGYDNS